MLPVSKFKDRADFIAVAIKHTIGIEGGFADDPRDSGGRTRWGITIRTARNFGYEGKMRELPAELAVEIYRTRFWTAARCDDFPPSLAVRMFDSAVNSGPAGAGQILQEAINVFRVWHGNGKHKPLIVDGAVGPKTMRALRQCYDFGRVAGQEYRTAFHLAFSEARNSFYLRLVGKRHKDAAFARGWEDRVDEMREFAAQVFRDHEAGR